MSEQEQSADALASEFVRTLKSTDNTAQEVIHVTRDKVELALHRNLPKYIPTGQLLASGGLALALLATLLTAEFREFVGISGEMWRGFFALAFLASLVIVIIDLIKWVRRPSLDDLVDAIEKDTRNGRREP